MLNVVRLCAVVYCVLGQWSRIALERYATCMWNRVTVIILI